MKKKITAIALIVALLGILIAGGTIAYFKDTDSATNVFTMGDIEIVLHEDNGDKNALGADYKLDDAYTEWVEDQVFEPSITLEKDAWISNTGSNDAYTRMFVVWPKTMNPMLDIKWDADLDANWTYTDVAYTIHGVEYVGRCLVYSANDGVLAAGKSTTDTITSVKLLNKVENETVNGIITYTLKDDATGTVYTHTSSVGQFPVLVYAQAGQVVNGENEWTNATEALNKMFGEVTAAPWNDEIDADFEAAIASGDVVVDGVTVTEITAGATDLTIDGTVVKTIGDHAGNYEYGRGENLKNLVVTEGVEALSYRTFKKNPTLETVVLPDSMNDLGDGAFQGCSALKSVTLPSNLTVLPTNTFYVSSLPEITLPETLTTIGENALRGTKLTEITIPENVTSIGRFAFRECPDLTEVTILSDNITLEGNMVFSHAQTGVINSTITFYVKNATVEAAVRAAVQPSEVADLAFIYIS